MKSQPHTATNVGAAGQSGALTPCLTHSASSQVKGPHAPEGAGREPARPPPQTENLRGTFCCHSPRSPSTTTGTRPGLSLDNTEIECLLFPFHMRKSRCPKKTATPVPTCSLLISDYQGSLPWAEGHGFSHTGCFFSDTLSGPWLFLQHATCLSPFTSHRPASSHTALSPPRFLKRNKLFSLGFRNIHPDC